jgi:signal peptidase I
VGDSLITEYTFKEDYCFVLGDNLFLSNDSRYWGPLPLGAITGRAVAAISLWPPSIRVLP